MNNIVVADSIVCYSGGMATDLPQRGEWHMITPEEEIKELERKLAEKKRAVAEAAGGAPAGAPPERDRAEKEMFREVIREHISEVQPPAMRPSETQLVSPPPVVSGAPSGGAAAPTPDKQAREEKLCMLVERAMTTTIEAAVRAAEKETPYLLDELHDRLADEYYEKLVQLRKLEAL